MELHDLIARETEVLRRLGRAVFIDRAKASDLVYQTFSKIRATGFRGDQRLFRLFALKTFFELGSKLPHDHKAALWNRLCIYFIINFERLSVEQVSLITSLSEREVKHAEKEMSSLFDASPRVKVQIIEDEPLIAFEWEAAVKRMRHEVTGIAVTASEAIQLAKLNKPDLIIADVQISGEFSGIEVAEEIERLTGPVPIIIETAYPEIILTMKSLSGPIDLLAKPYHLSAMHASINRILCTDITLYC